MKKLSRFTSPNCFDSFAFKTIDNSKPLGVVYTDFQKAFNQLDHQLHLKKLEAIGWYTLPFTVLKTYLPAQNQNVFYKKKLLFFFVSTSGVFKGSNLRPFLFLIPPHKINKLALIIYINS